ncbi:MAG: threonine/serine dehydratase, partial [Gemmatimonadetes bacterium]
MLDAVRRHAVRTPLLRPADPVAADGSPALALKLENLQATGSFKVRGAAARMARLTPDERAAGVIAVSSGNHGRAVAYVARREGVRAVVCVPEWVDPLKLAAMRAEGAEVRLAGTTYDEAESVAREAAEREGAVWIDPFDDPWVMAGQGTIGLELAEQAPDAAAVVVPLSGGGLVSGVAAALREAWHRRADDGDGAEPRPAPRVIAVSAERASVMLASVRAGRPVTLPEEPTLAGALSGGIGADNRYTFRAVRELVDEHVTVTEEEIGRAMAFAASRMKLLVEGGGAVALAASMAGKLALPE